MYGRAIFMLKSVETSEGVVSSEHRDLKRRLGTDWTCFGKQSRCPYVCRLQSKRCRSSIKKIDEFDEKDFSILIISRESAFPRESGRGWSAATSLEYRRASLAALLQRRRAEWGVRSAEWGEEDPARLQSRGDAPSPRVSTHIDQTHEYTNCTCPFIYPAGYIIDLEFKTNFSFNLNCHTFPIFSTGPHRDLRHSAFHSRNYFFSNHN